MEKKLSASGLNEALSHLAKIAGAIDELEIFVANKNLSGNILFEKDEAI